MTKVIKHPAMMKQEASRVTKISEGPWNDAEYIWLDCVAVSWIDYIRCPGAINDNNWTGRDEMQPRMWIPIYHDTNDQRIISYVQDNMTTHELAGFPGRNPAGAWNVSQGIKQEGFLTRWARKIRNGIFRNRR